MGEVLVKRLVVIDVHVVGAEGVQRDTIIDHDVTCRLFVHRVSYDANGSGNVSFDIASSPQVLVVIEER